jgi:hypothetical protein
VGPFSSPAPIPCVVTGATGPPPLIRLLTPSIPVSVRASDGILAWPGGTAVEIWLEITPGVQTRFNLVIVR